MKSIRDLFDGLAISKTDWQWEKWPVIHFEFADVASSSLEAFDRDFGPIVKKRLADAGFDGYDEAKSPGYNFGNAIDSLSAANGGRGVVVLVDEYDAPVSHALDDLALAETIRKRLADFYSVMKTRTGAIRFLMMTGVSKFTKMSVFSCLNNIVDISLDEEFATMLGYTEDELSANFEEHLREHADRMNLAYDDYRAGLKRWYNGEVFAPMIARPIVPVDRKITGILRHMVVNRSRVDLDALPKEGGIARHRPGQDETSLGECV